MPKVHFEGPSTGVRAVDADGGESLMQAAVRYGVTEIEARCGGALACGSCHVYLAEPWHQRVPPPSAAEREMLEYVLERRDNSRLACQIKIEGSLDGIVVHLPGAQAQ
jgi:2Fe-2S ferredoxin